MRRAVLLILGVLLTGPVLAQKENDVDVLMKLHAEAIGTDAVESRTMAKHQLVVARALFKRQLEGDGERLAADWQTLGFELLAVGNDSNGFLVLREAPDRRQGRGFYVFPRSRSRGKAILVQAPHGTERDDLLTSAIAHTLMSGGKPVVAGAWSTLPRKTLDLTHTTETIFEAMMLAFAEVHPRGRILQIHGFNRQKRETTRGRKASIIASDGTESPRPDLERYATCLSRALDVDAAVFPTDVRELGALTNTQGTALRQSGSFRFFHLELSLGLRRRLAANAADVRHLESCLP
jgi:hypothetical protein